jgi:hypothetical protein
VSVLRWLRLRTLGPTRAEVRAAIRACIVDVTPPRETTDVAELRARLERTTNGLRAARAECDQLAAEIRIDDDVIDGLRRDRDEARAQRDATSATSSPRRSASMMT